MIKRIFVVSLLVLFAFATGSQARVATMPLGKGTVSIDFPDAWKVSSIERGLEAKTGDEEVYVWAEAYTESQIDQLMKEHGDYFTKQGVAITGPVKSQARVVNGVNMKMLDVPATWHGKPTVLQYLLVDPGVAGGWKVMLTEWASPEGDKQYQPDLDRIMNGLSFGTK